MSTYYFTGSADELIRNFDKQFNNVSPYRRERINSYKQPEDKRLCLAATLLLERALSEFGLKESEMDYYVNDYGKPYFKNRSDIFFSLSHSGNYAMAAASDKEIGCDIQQIKNIDIKLSKRFFTAEENKYVKNIDDFFRVWTLKESFIKLKGKGLSMPLNSFCIENLDALPYTDFDGVRYIFKENKIDGYHLSVCQKL